MNVLALAVLVHIFAIHGMQWEGAASAWMLAVLLDVVLYVYLVYSYFGTKF